MPTYKIAAIALIALGALGLIYGGFNYTKATHQIEIGPLTLSVDETEYVSVPLWAGIAGIVIGAALLLVARRS
jgi:TRAP-type C4-dicarboxylate transport system permease small subunit